jgi:hypothetical protein
MRPRVSQTTLKRITKLDAPLREELNRAAYVIAMYQGIDTLNDSERAKFTRAQRTILSWPSLLSCEEWEALSVPSQQKLIDASHEDRADRGEQLVMYVESKDEAAFRAHRESEVLYQQERREQPQVIRDYLNAQVRKA